VKRIYFACSISGGRDHAHIYGDIVASIKQAGGEVLSELFADKALVSEIGTDPGHTPNFIWARDCGWMKQADAIIAEVTQPSLGVGYEIGKAEEWGKPVLALFNKSSGKRLSPMISGSPQVQLFEYSEVDEVATAIRTFIESLA